MAYTRPVNPTGLSSWYAHTQRRPASQETGVDYYCDMGTQVKAIGDGYVAGIGGSIYDATGRWLTIDLDDGRRVRYLHLMRYHKALGDRVRQGAVVAYSGASGYGSEYFGAEGMHDFPWGETGGPHVHVTLWPSHRYVFGNYAATLDLEQYVEGGSAAGGGAVDFPEGDELNDSDKAWVRECFRQELAATFATVNQIARGEILYPGAGYYAFPAVVGVIREDDATTEPAVVPRDDE